MTAQALFLMFFQKKIFQNFFSIKSDRYTTTVCTVSGASLKYDVALLGDNLNLGPSLTKPLFAVLLRFRTNRLAYTTDIEKALLSNLQLNFDETDHAYVQLTYFEHLDNSVVNKYSAKSCSYRFCRVLFGVTSSPFLLSNTLIKHINSYNDIDRKFVCKILILLHANNLNSGSENFSGAFDFFIGGKSCLANASFSLQKFSSNSHLLEKLLIKFVLTDASDIIKKFSMLRDKLSDLTIFQFKESRK